MKIYKYCWINSLAITTLMCGCASAPTPVKLSKSEIRADKIFEYYCADNKQIRKLSVSIEYVTPSFPKMAVDKAAKEQTYYAKRKLELFKKTLFSLSGGEERPNGRGADYLKARQSDLNHKELIEYVSGYSLEENSYSSTRIRALLIKPTDTDKFILFHGIERDMRFPLQDYKDPTYISELNLLMDNFTLLEPVEFQNEAYKCDESCLKDPYQDHGKIDLIAVDDDGKQSVSESITHKDSIWIRYIQRFTKINEAKSSNPRVVNVDLDLDLKGFCRYGRSISDLQSQ